MKSSSKKITSSAKKFKADILWARKGEDHVNKTIAKKAGAHKIPVKKRARIIPGSNDQLDYIDVHLRSVKIKRRRFRRIENNCRGLYFGENLIRRSTRTICRKLVERDWDSDQPVQKRKKFSARKRLQDNLPQI